MATTAKGLVEQHPEAPKLFPKALSRPAKALAWLVTVVTVGLLVWGVASSWSSLSESALDMIPWLLLVSAAELLPVFYLPEVNMTLSMPLLLAAGMTLGPLPAGLLGFLGSWDGRHLRGEIPWAHALFNRSQIALSSMAAAWTFHALNGTVDQWPKVLLPCFAAIAADVLINVALVSYFAVLVSGNAIGKVVKSVALDHPLLFVSTYLGLAPLALLLATADRHHGIAGLIAGVVPILMARQVFALLKRTSIANRHAREQEAMIEQLTHRIEVERRDERARLAMDLHDGALADLYRVHLMGEVLRQDLLNGRLLELEADVPDLRDATTAATDSLRELIRGLRDSSVGANGVCKTLALLVDELSSSVRARFHTDITPVDLDPSVQLLVYQVARESLENAVRHSDAQNISVTLRNESDSVRLVVRDDGIGFDRSAVDTSRHFGLAIMAQRVEAAGGMLNIASEPGWGTQVVARLPVNEHRATSFRKE
jgi:signal transduction histidine kinase